MVACDGWMDQEWTEQSERCGWKCVGVQVSEHRLGVEHAWRKGGQLVGVQAPGWWAVCIGGEWVTSMVWGREGKRRST